MKRRFMWGVLIILLMPFFYYCSNPYRTTNKSYKKQVKHYTRQIREVPLKDSISSGNWVGTTNFNLRKPNFVVIHHTAQKSCEETLKTFTTTKTSVSAHYVICKDGTVYHMLNDYLRAWHGGVARWGNTSDLNSSSIGIEIDNDGAEPFTEEQIRSLELLLSQLKKTYSIPAANFIGHSDIAPGRKVDPNVNFPWKRLSDSGYGLWWSDTTGVVVPEGFNALQALRIIGYPIRDSFAAVSSFKRKYLQLDKDSILTQDDRKVLFTLYKKYE